MEAQETIDAINELDANVVVLSRLYRVLADPNSDIDTIAELIITDGPLSAAVLRMSNGAFYGSSEPVESISGAIYKIGFREIIRLVSAFISRKIFMHDLKHYRMSARQYWTYSYFCASLMEWLVHERADRVLAYLFGLFHPIGRLGFEKVLRNAQSPMIWDPSQPIELWETKVFGITSIEVGAAALESWEFDPVLCQLVATQLHPDHSPNPHLSRSLAVARDIAMANDCDMSLPEWEIPMRESLAEKIKTDPETLQNYTDASFHSVKTMHVHLG